MKLEPFKLDAWLDDVGPRTRYDLAASTGPKWTLKQVYGWMTPSETEALEEALVVYGAASGNEDLRRELGAMQGVAPEHIQVVSGAAEALWILFFLAAEPGANVVVPDPCFPTFAEVPRALGLETRSYRLRAENRFRLDPDEVLSLVDDHTKLVLVNSPHNPTGSVIDDDTLTKLHDHTAEREITFVVDEVYHPIYHGEQRTTAARLPRATILGDFSKALCLSGLRIGWFVERDRDRLAAYWNARAYFSISNSYPAEALGVIAARRRETIWSRARDTAKRNLAFLDDFFASHEEQLEWVRPEGGFTGFPRLRDGSDARPMALAAAERGVMVAPGDCFGHPAHFRVGFGACDEGFDRALEILGEVLVDTATLKS